MKVIIDLIEDIRTAINNDGSFSLMAMGLKETQDGEFVPAWESRLSLSKLDDEKKTLYLFLGKDKALGIDALLQDLNALANEKMMYEVRVSYSKDAQRIDSPLLGFGESLENKQYIFFVSGE